MRQRCERGWQRKGEKDRRQKLSEVLRHAGEARLTRVGHLECEGEDKACLWLSFGVVNFYDKYSLCFHRERDLPRPRSSTRKRGNRKIECILTTYAPCDVLPPEIPRRVATARLLCLLRAASGLVCRIWQRDVKRRRGGLRSITITRRSNNHGAFSGSLVRPVGFSFPFSEPFLFPYLPFSFSFRSDDSPRNSLSASTLGVLRNPVPHRELLGLIKTKFTRARVPQEKTAHAETPTRAPGSGSLTLYILEERIVQTWKFAGQGFPRRKTTTLRVIQTKISFSATYIRAA